MIAAGSISGQSDIKTVTDYSDQLNGGGGGNVYISISSGLREGSVQSLGIKMEQCRNSLAGRHGKRASSSGGASPLPLFHFLFLLLVRVDNLGHLRLPPGATVGHHHGYCIRLILLQQSNMQQTRETDFYQTSFSSVSKIPNWFLKKSYTFLIRTNKRGKMLEEDGWPKNLLSKDHLLI